MKIILTTFVLILSFSLLACSDSAKKSEIACTLSSSAIQNPTPVPVKGDNISLTFTESGTATLSCMGLPPAPESQPSEEGKIVITSANMKAMKKSDKPDKVEISLSWDCSQCTCPPTDEGGALKDIAPPPPARGTVVNGTKAMEGNPQPTAGEKESCTLEQTITVQVGTVAPGGSVCGNMVCETGEDANKCPVDCTGNDSEGDGGSNSGTGSGDGGSNGEGPGEDDNDDDDPGNGDVAGGGNPPPSAENCIDGIDNDQDGFTDANDPDCGAGGTGGGNAGGGRSNDDDDADEDETETAVLVVEAPAGYVATVVPSLRPRSYTDGRKRVALVVKLYSKVNFGGSWGTFVHSVRDTNWDGVGSIKIWKGPNYCNGDKIRVYGDQNYNTDDRGSSIELVPGKYPDFERFWRGNNRLTTRVQSIKYKLVRGCREADDLRGQSHVWSHKIPIILYLYQDKNYSGDIVRIIHDIGNLDDMDFNNRASSAKVRKGPDFNDHAKVKVWESKNYKDGYQFLKVNGRARGNYPDLSTINFKNNDDTNIHDDIEAVTIRGQECTRRGDKCEY
ncbi:MAG: hypothetical protein HYS22_07860 [Deltaproteobacteria bacterium]|nr:hypothetical protein [Deltaproteobacteria bacterium]